MDDSQCLLVDDPRYGMRLLAGLDPHRAKILVTNQPSRQQVRGSLFREREPAHAQIGENLERGCRWLARPTLDDCGLRGRQRVEELRAQFARECLVGLPEAW